MQDLLEHATREFEGAGWQPPRHDESRGPDMPASRRGASFQRGGAESAMSPGASDEDERRTDTPASGRPRGSPMLRSCAGTGTGLSRKRQRADISNREATGSECSDDGSAPASQSSGGDTGAVARKKRAGTKQSV